MSSVSWICLAWLLRSLSPLRCRWCSVEMMPHGNSAVMCSTSVWLLVLDLCLTWYWLWGVAQFVQGSLRIIESTTCEQLTRDIRQLHETIMPLTSNQDVVLLLLICAWLMSKLGRLGHDMLNVLRIQSIDHVKEELPVEWLWLWIVIRQEQLQLLVLMCLL